MERRGAMECEAEAAASVEITPAMVAAGVASLMASGLVEWKAPDWLVTSVVRDLLAASLATGTAQDAERP